jgi:hypothetical protein
MNKKLIFIELNELNFDLAKAYTRLHPHRFKNFLEIFKKNNLITKSEDSYEYLEPWIQWPSIRTGKTFAEHKIFRLGDINYCIHPEYYSILESNGIKVGCISPINSRNNLKEPSFFIPDPWTDTSSDNSWTSKSIHKLIRQVVNDNSKSRITINSLLILLFLFFRFAKIKNYSTYLTLIFKVLQRKGWNKALFFDLILHDLHIGLNYKYKPDFSTIFFNAGAHIQHHYLFSSQLNFFNINKNIFNNQITENADPILDALLIYEQILGNYLADTTCSLVIATGLTQVPYDRLKYYYRLKNHDAFLKLLGISFISVKPKMTRDFSIYFSSEEECISAKLLLSSLKIDGDNMPIFKEIESTGKRLFVTLTYPNLISKRIYLYIN